MSAEERAAMSKLTEADLRIIGDTILANASTRWLKVARIVMSTENALCDRYPDLSYIFYAEHLSQLVKAGRLESQGNLTYMRFSEVRLPESEGNG